MKKNKKGFSLIDIIVALAIIGLVFIGIYQLFIISTQASYTRSKKMEAVQLAQETIEAVRTLRNNGWTDNMTTLAEDTEYYLVLSGDEWTLSVIPTSLINDLFDRTVLLESVYRDEDDNIADSGTLDPKTKKVVATVEWQERGQINSVVLETYLTNFFGT